MRDCPGTCRPRGVEAVLASVRDNPRHGARDYAMLLLMARLGLRALEVIAITIFGAVSRLTEIRGYPSFAQPKPAMLKLSSRYCVASPIRTLPLNSQYYFEKPKHQRCIQPNHFHSYLLLPRRYHARCKNSRMRVQ